MNAAIHLDNYKAEALKQMDQVHARLETIETRLRDRIDGHTLGDLERACHWSAAYLAGYVIFFLIARTSVSPLLAGACLAVSLALGALVFVENLQNLKYYDSILAQLTRIIQLKDRVAADRQTLSQADFSPDAILPSRNSVLSEADACEETLSRLALREKGHLAKIKNLLFCACFILITPTGAPFLSEVSSHIFSIAINLMGEREPLIQNPQAWAKVIMVITVILQLLISAACWFTEQSVNHKTMVITLGGPPVFLVICLIVSLFLLLVQLALFLALFLALGYALFMIIANL